MKKLIFVFVSLLVGINNSFAKEEILATITNDENKVVFHFVASSDDSTQTLNALYKDDYINGKKIDRAVLPTDDLTNDGVILDKRGDRTVISLKSDNFDNLHGGHVVIDTLYNGVTGERKEYELELTKDEDSWKLYNGASAISKIHIEVNKKLFIGTVGVKNIRME